MVKPTEPDTIKRPRKLFGVQTTAQPRVQVHIRVPVVSQVYLGLVWPVKSQAEEETR